MHIYVILKLKIGIKHKLGIIFPYILSLMFVVYNQLMQRAQGGFRESYIINFDFAELTRKTAEELSITAEKKNLKLIY
jgi:hypothetical protein